MVVTVSSDDARSVKALALLATADRWTKGHRKSDGRPFFVIPGSQGRVYWTDCRECTCPDFTHIAPQERGFACKHILACRMWKLQQNGKGAARGKRAKKQGKGGASAAPTPTPPMVELPGVGLMKVCACGALFNPAFYPGEKCRECGGRRHDEDEWVDMTAEYRALMFSRAAQLASGAFDSCAVRGCTNLAEKPAKRCRDCSGRLRIVYSELFPGE